MKQNALIGIGAGFVAAVLSVSVAAGALSVFSLVLFLSAPLPLFIVGMGWGAIAAASGAVSGALTLVLVLGFPQGVSFLISIGAPPVLLSYLALLSRPGGTAPQGADDQPGEREWYPVGRLVLWVAGVAGTLVAITVVLTGPDAQSYRDALQAAIEQSIKLQPGLAETLQADEENLKAFIAFFIRMTPIFLAGFWTLLTLGNMWIAIKTLEISGRSMRPWAPFPDIAFPRISVAVLGALVVASLLPDTLGLFAEGYTSALVTAFAILGLAVLHRLTRDFPARIFLLVSVYLAIVMFNWLAALLLAALGIAELGFGLRARMAHRGQGGSNT